MYIQCWVPEAWLTDRDIVPGLEGGGLELRVFLQEVFEPEIKDAERGLGRRLSG